MTNKQSTLGNKLAAKEMKQLKGGILLPEDCRLYGEPCRRTRDCCESDPVLTCQGGCCLF